MVNYSFAFLWEIIFNSLSPPTHEKEINKVNSNQINKLTSKLIYYPEQLDKIDIKPRERTDEVDVSWK